MLFPQLVPNVGVVITVKAESCPDDWTEITCSCWAFYPLFCFSWARTVSSSRQEDLAATVVQQRERSD